MSAVDDLSLAKQLLSSNRIPESLDAFKRAAAEPSLRAEALYGIGHICKRGADWDGACNAFRAALRSDPHHANASFALGEIFERDNLATIAQSLFELCVRSRPDHHGANQKLLAHRGYEGSAGPPPSMPPVEFPPEPEAPKPTLAPGRGLAQQLRHDRSPMGQQILALLESVQTSTRPRLRAYLSRILAVLLAMPTIGFVARATGVVARRDEDIIFAIGMTISFVFLAILILTVKCRHISISDGRIIVKSGILFRSTSTTELYRISDLDLSQGPINRLTGDALLTLRVESGGKEIDKLFLRGVAGVDRMEILMNDLRSLILFLRSGGYGAGVRY